MGQPTQKQQISEADAKIVSGFQEFITVGVSADGLRRALTQVYINYTKMLVRNNADYINTDTETELFYLSGLIEVLDETKI